MTVKTFADLAGLKEENVAEFKTIGIETVDDLKAAVNDDAKVKEIVKTLSGVGPKTVEKWKGQFAGEASAEKPKKAAVEVVEETEEEQAYAVKAKPTLAEETEDALAKRAIISGNRPAFRRQEWFRRAKFKDSTWRRPKGIHSKMKRGLKRRPPVVDIGFRGPAAARDLHPSGFVEVLVYNTDGLEGVDPKVQAVRIGGTVGTKKRLEIQARADELGIRVLNRMV